MRNITLKVHLINWKFVSLPRNRGSLGIGDIVKKNLALLQKWMWRFRMEPNSLWYKVIKSMVSKKMSGILIGC